MAPPAAARPRRLSDWNPTREYSLPMTRRPGRVSFAMVPFEERWHSLLLRPLTFVTNGLLSAWIYPCWRTARVRWEPHFDRLLDVGRGDRPLIFYSWHEYEPLLFLAFRDVPPELKASAIGHDGLLSRMLQRTGARLGYHIWIYRRKSPVRPRDQIIEFIRTRKRPIGLIPDAGGPYRRVKPGITEIARATNALVVPLVPAARGTLTAHWPKRFRFPLPFCSVTVHTGTPLDPANLTAEECQAALESVEREASQSG